jgi:hypothetical protein
MTKDNKKKPTAHVAQSPASQQVTETPPQQKKDKLSDSIGLAPDDIESVGNLGELDLSGSGLLNLNLDPDASVIDGPALDEIMGIPEVAAPKPLISRDDFGNISSYFISKGYEARECKGGYAYVGDCFTISVSREGKVYALFGFNYDGQVSAETDKMQLKETVKRWRKGIDKIVLSENDRKFMHPAVDGKKHNMTVGYSMKFENPLNKPQLDKIVSNVQSTYERVMDYIKRQDGLNMPNSKAILGSDAFKLQEEYENHNLRHNRSPVLN